MAHLGTIEQQLRDAIAQTKKQAQEQPQRSQADRLRELSKQHYERTGAGGGA